MLIYLNNTFNLRDKKMPSEPPPPPLTVGYSCGSLSSSPLADAEPEPRLIRQTHRSLHRWICSVRTGLSLNVFSALFAEAKTF